MILKIPCQVNFEQMQKGRFLLLLDIKVFSDIRIKYMGIFG